MRLLGTDVFSRKRLITDKMCLTDTVPVYKMHLTNTVPVNKMHLTDSVPVNKMHLTDTVPVNKMHLTITVPDDKIHPILKTWGKGLPECFRTCLDLWPCTFGHTQGCA